MLICMRTSIHIPDDLLARAKVKAAQEGRTLTSLVEEGLRLVLSSKTSRGRPKVEPLPVSSVADGVVPGIDLSNSAQLQELMDDETIRKNGLVKLR